MRVRLCAAIARQQGRPEDGLPIMAAAMLADSTNLTWPLGQALLLASLGRHAEAIDAFDRAIALSAPDPSLQHARAESLRFAGRLAGAVTGYDAAIALDPTDAIGSHIGRARALRRLLRYDEAIAVYDHVIEIQEDSADAYLAKVLLLLSKGQYNEGWALHEWRWFTPDFPEKERLFRQPYWDGTPRCGKILLGTC